MKLSSLQFTVSFLVLLAFNASATPRYVDLNSPNATPPFTNWSTAATNIQDAIDVSADGDSVFVTNGVYAVGGRVMDGDLTNRVALDKALTVQSVNGPWVTTIQGGSAPGGSAAVRCAWLTNGAFLSGFTLKGGATRTSGTASLLNGGGVWCASSNAIVANCIIRSNTANQYGGGSYQGTLNNCLISSNTTTAANGAAVCNATLNNCTVVSNSGLGIYQTLPNTVRATNCIVYFNSGGNYAGVTLSFSYCCTTPAVTGAGNFTNAPQLFADGVHLTSGSPCIGTGTNLVTGTDIFGLPWANPPSVGCAEWQSAPFILAPRIQFSPGGFSVNVAADGLQPFTCWWNKDGVPIQDNGHYSSSQTTNLIVSGPSLFDEGTYRVVVSNAFGVVTSAETTLAIHCVDMACSSPSSPFLSWATAATNIQDAINAASPGDIILVTNGVYSSGGKVVAGDLTNRVALDKPVIVQSVNGPFATAILGAGATNGTSAVRCALVTDGAALVGFTIQAGATRSAGDTTTLRSGGGVWCAAPGAVVANCVIRSNTVYSNGGGAYQGTLMNCFITANYSSLFSAGSATYNSTLINCTVVSNAYAAYIANYAGTFVNCIVYFNGGGNYDGNAVLSYSCTTPQPSGNGNISAAPKLALDQIHLTSASPCRGAGTNLTSRSDIFGNAWANPPSMGCAEWQPAPLIAQPVFHLTSSPVGFNIGLVVIAGQEPFTFGWQRDGIALQDDGHFSGTQSTNLIADGISWLDAGNYQLVVSNAFGVVTSAVAQVVIHAVDVAGVNPVPPFSTWAAAATNIQDAINIAAAGDIVLVTNGVYATGGKVEAGDLTNRVSVDKPITVTSVNGCTATVIQGAWDPATTNGPLAVRCAWLTNGAALSGFTLLNGATRATGDSFSGGPLESGGGVWCASTNGVVSNCILSNNNAIYGGGISYGTLNNSYVVFNFTVLYGAGAYYATLNNCTVVNNYTTTSFQNHGAGTYDGITRNSIVVGNFDNFFAGGFTIDNYAAASGPQQPQYTYSCSYSSLGQTPSGAGNINGLNTNLQFLNSFHISSSSPCRGAGSVLYASGTDLDGEPWANSPSMGCDEVIVSNLVGPLSVNILAYQTNLLVNRYDGFGGVITGRASGATWSFGDGPTVTNAGAGISHQWTNAGNYTTTFTAYNNDHPAGVSTNVLIHVLPLNAPQLQSALLLTNGFRFQFTGQLNANYTVQYATNLAPPATWQTMQNIFSSNGGVHQITDATAPSGTRFYRVLAQ